jgi:hypothetical protein
MQASDSPPPPSGRPGERYTERRVTDEQVGRPRVAELALRALEPGTDRARKVAPARSVALDSVQRFVTLYRMNRDAPHLPQLANDIAMWLLREAREVAGDEPCDLSVEARVEGSLLRAEYRHYAWEPRGGPAGWRELDRWSDSVPSDGTRPVAFLQDASLGAPGAPASLAPRIAPYIVTLAEELAPRAREAVRSAPTLRGTLHALGATLDWRRGRSPGERYVPITMVGTWLAVSLLLLYAVVFQRVEVPRPVDSIYGALSGVALSFLVIMTDRFSKV